MPSDRAADNLATRLSDVVYARPTMLGVGVLVFGLCVFAALDAAKVRPNDGTVWLLGRTTLAVLDVPGGTGEATPLQKGDKIIGIAHRLVRGPGEAADQLKRQQPGTTVPYLIEREGLQMEIDVPLTGFRVADRSYLINVCLALVYFAIGLLVYVKSQNDRPARLFYLLCLAFAVYFMTNLVRSSYFWGDIITRNCGALARFLLPAFFLQFFLVFPEKKHALTKHPFLLPLVYILPLMLYVRFTLDQFFGDRGARIEAGTWLILGLFYVAGLVALMHSYFSYRDPLLRDRVRILTWGTLAAVLPFLVFKVGLEEITSNSELAQFGVIPLVAIPVSFGYCVARYQVLQIDFLVKRSLLYSVLTGLLLLTFVGTVFWIGTQIVAFTRSANPLTAVGVTLGVAALLWPGRVRLQGLLEQRFYRSRANLADLLQRFGREIPRLIQRQTLLDHVGTGLAQALALPALWVYLAERQEGETVWRLSWRSTLPTPGTTRSRELPAEIPLSATMRVIQNRLEPFWIDRTAPRPLEGHQPITREQAELAARRWEQALLAEAGIEMLVPLATSDRVIGLLVLPAKPGGEEYQIHEIQLLTIVAGQTAMQLENTRLYEEEVNKQKLEEEMTLARAIQSRLLPTRLPSYPGVEIHAVNVSSKMVSGDYYDMIEREDGQLVIAIADVSGKGMPASLLASNLQAALRAQVDVFDAPGAILSRLNRQLHAATDPMHFATLFLVFFDPVTRRLRYSSGGHNAPLLLRADGPAEMLAEGGLPLGAFDFGVYEEGETFLREGDLLLLYTDGVTETKSPDLEDEFGEDRLECLLSEHRDRSVPEIIAAIDTELQRFRGRREAEDDITVVGLKIATASASAQTLLASRLGAKGAST
jgi:sigma-B regulation protein RsbU (phosphoserine phosphatase)